MMSAVSVEYRESTYAVCEMCEQDLETIIGIEQAAQAHPWTRGHFISSIESSHHCYVLRHEEQIVAYAITSTAADEAELLNITVSPQQQRQGLGRLLLEHISETFNASIHTLFLEVRASNQPAIALYDALYFNEVGLRPNYYPSKNGSREDAIIMAKPLGSTMEL